MDCNLPMSALGGVQVWAVLFPSLLFALALEPLAQVVGTAITIADNQHMTLYADALLICTTRPEVSTSTLIEIISKFGVFLGYRMNFKKSKANATG